MESKRVLIVEDEAILALELTEDLKQSGFDVVGVVTNGDMVLSEAMKSKPDVIVMDIKLHGFRDGIEAALRIRGLLKVPIVYLSTYSYEAVKDRVAKTVPAYYLEKPYNEVEFIRTIHNAIESPPAH